MRNRIKWLAGLTAVTIFSVMGLAQGVKAEPGNLPSSSVGTIKTFAFVGTSSVKNICNTNSVSDALTTTTSTITQGNIIYSMRIISDRGTNQTAGLWDVADIINVDGSAESTNMVDEVSEATQYKTSNTYWAGPYKLENGFCLTTDGAPTVQIQYN